MPMSKLHYRLQLMLYACSIGTEREAHLYICINGYIQLRREKGYIKIIFLLSIRVIMYLV